VNPANNVRLIATKTVLWLLVGAASVIAVARYARGLGATTALTDANPWGLWIGFDVLSGVALAAGGFVIAATVYIFHLDRYHALVRPAVLTAFLGYVAVALGLMVDLGRPWNIWRPIFYWQSHSPLFEVAWCVMLYLTVLALEFLPVVFEGLKWQRAFQFMRRMTLALVITGIGLSTLHQSSLGTLFLLAKDRMHPLWYSPLLPLLFFVSAVGLGLVVVTTEACISSWLFRRDTEWPLLRGLTRAASVVIGLYLVLRIGDLAWRSQLHYLLVPSWTTVLFVVEVAMSAAIPILLFTLPKTRDRGWAVATGAVIGVAGFVLHRANVGGIAHIPITGQPYVPALTEILVSCGLVAGMALIFLYFVEHFPVWEEEPVLPDHFTPPMRDPVSRIFFGGPWFGRAHLAGLGWVVGVVLGVVVLESTTAGKALPTEVSVQVARSVPAIRVERDGRETSRLVPLEHPVTTVELQPGFITGLLIDGDRAGCSTLFDHEGHRRRLGGEASCGRCHHRNLPLDRGTPCSVCHADMYRCTDIFDHEHHVAELGANASCARCHRDPAAGKGRAEATACLECHAADVIDCFTEERHPCVARTHSGDMACIGCHEVGSPGLGSLAADHRLRCGVAPGYRLAMHQLCIECHCVHQTETGADEPLMTRCSCCHRGAQSNLDVQPTALKMADVRRWIE